MQDQSRRIQKYPRPKIFDGAWQNNLARIASRPPTNSFNNNINSQQKQSISAQQALQKSLLFVRNIQYFLQQKTNIKKMYDQYSVQSSALRKQLQKSTQESKNVFSQTTYEQKLKQFYLHIRKQMNLINQAQGFKLSNLSNYDPKVAALKPTRTIHQSNQQLMQKLKQIQFKRNRLQQALSAYQKQLPQSHILHNEFDLQKSIQDVNRLITNQNMTNIHYLMQYQLNEVDDQFNTFARRVADDRANYAIYQALNDSMKLMINQKQDMRRQIGLFKNGFTALHYDNALTQVPKLNTLQPIFSNNQRVMQSNLQLLARYNAQTNLSQYTRRRNQYTSQLGLYKHQLKKWKKQHQTASYLYQRHQVLDNFTKRKPQLALNPLLLKIQKQKVKQAHYQSLNWAVPDRLQRLHAYRRDLLSQFDKVLISQGVIVHQPSSMIPLTQSKSFVDKQGKYQKYLNFFMQLQALPRAQRPAYLKQQLNNIKAIKFQLQHLNNQQPAQITSYYKTGYQYCQAIGQHEYNMSSPVFFDRIRKISNNGKIKFIPMGIDSIIYYYTADMINKMDLQTYVEREFGPSMRDMSIHITYALMMQKQQPDYNNKKYTQQFIKKAINFPIQKRTIFYTFLYRKLTQYTPQIKKYMVNVYWTTAQRQVLNAYRNANIITFPTINSINNKNFMQFDTLAYLQSQKSNIVIENLEQLVQYYISYIDSYDFRRLDQIQLFLQIIRQRILLSIIQQKSLKKPSLNVYKFLLSNINMACMLLYQTNDHLQLFNTTDLQAHFQQSIKIEKDWKKLHFNKQLGSHYHLYEKCLKIIMHLQRLPIATSTNAEWKYIDAIINMQGKLKKLSALSRVNDQVYFNAITYTKVDKYLQDLHLADKQFNNSDMISVRDNSRQAVYLEKMQKQSYKILKVMQPHLAYIMSIFKGKINNRRDPVNNYTNQLQQNLNAIARRIQRNAVGVE